MDCFRGSNASHRSAYFSAAKTMGDSRVKWSWELCLYGDRNRGGSRTGPSMHKIGDGGVYRDRYRVNKRMTNEYFHRYTDMASPETTLRVASRVSNNKKLHNNLQQPHGLLRVNKPFCRCRLRNFVPTKSSKP